MKKKNTKLKGSGVSFFIWKIRVIVLVVVRVLESKDLYYQKGNTERIRWKLANILQVLFLQMVDAYIPVMRSCFLHF